MKLVINSCHGDFGLSPIATKAFAAKKGRECYFFSDGIGKPYKQITVDEADKLGLFWTAFDVPVLEQDAVGELPDGWFEAHYIEPPRDNRTDPDLLAVVRELGERANGMCAKLSIVEIPDGIEYTIEEYDGYEHVAEVRRKWYAPE